jgi:signal transduction histidine kinase
MNPGSAARITHHKGRHSHPILWNEQIASGMTEPTYIAFIAILAAALLTPSMVFLALAAENRGNRYWRLLAVATSILFGSTTLSALQNLLPVSILFTWPSNLLLGFGYFYIFSAVSEVTTPGRNNRPALEFLVVYAIAVSIVAILFNTYTIRIFVVGVGVAGFSAMIFFKLLRNRAPLNRLGVHVIISSLFVNFMVAVGRSFAAVVDNAGYLSSLDFWSPAFFLGSTISVIGGSIGLFMIGQDFSMDRLQLSLDRERELSKKLLSANEDQKNLQIFLLHELKRPINAISAALQVEATRSGSGGLSLHAERISALVDQVVTYLEKVGDYEDLSSLLESPNKSLISVRSIARDAANKWNIAVGAAPSLENEVLMADALLIDVSIGNMVENALKYATCNSEVRLLIHADDTHLIFDVEDPGPGIPEEEWSNVWQKFYRIGPTSQNPYTGCGLGLHVVKRVAEVHGGYSCVVSRKPSRIRLALAKLDIGALKCQEEK